MRYGIIFQKVVDRLWQNLVDDLHKILVEVRMQIKTRTVQRGGGMCSVKCHPCYLWLALHCALAVFLCHLLKIWRFIYRQACRYIHERFGRVHKAMLHCPHCVFSTHCCSRGAISVVSQPCDGVVTCSGLIPSLNAQLDISAPIASQGARDTSMEYACTGFENGNNLN